jgi:opacity protein-like surface antigen
MGEFQKSFSPYFSAGVAMIQSADEVKTRNTTNPQSLPEEGDKDVFIGFPFGAGLRWDFSEQFSLGLEGIWYATFSDYLDGVSKYGNPSKKDWIMSGTVYVSYFFGRAEPDFNFSGKSKHF